MKTPSLSFVITSSAVIVLVFWMVRSSSSKIPTSESSTPLSLVDSLYLEARNTHVMPLDKLTSAFESSLLNNELRLAADFALGIVYENIGSGDLENAKAFIDNFLLAQDSLPSIRALGSCGSGYLDIKIGPSNDALSDLNICLEYFAANRHVYPHVYGHALHLTALWFHEQGQFEKSLEYYNTALEFRKDNTSDSQIDRAATLNNIGNVYWKSGQLRKALTYHERALLLKQNILTAGHPDISASLNNIGNVLADLGEYEQALEFHKTAFGQRMGNLGKHPATAHSLHNMSEALFHLGRHSESFESMKKALDMKQQTVGSQHPDYINSISYLGYFYSYTHRFLLADSLFNISSVFCRLNKSYVCSDTEVLQNLHLLKQGKVHQIESLLDVATQNERNIVANSNPLTSELYLGMAEHFRKLKNYPKALKFAKLGIYAASGLKYENLLLTPTATNNVSNRDRLIDLLGIVSTLYNEIAHHTNSKENLIFAQQANVLSLILLDESFNDPWTDISRNRSSNYSKDISERGIRTSLRLFEIDDNKQHLYSAFEFADYGNNWALQAHLVEVESIAKAGAPEFLVLELKSLVSELVNLNRRENTRKTQVSIISSSRSDSIFSVKERLAKLRKNLLDNYPLFAEFRSNRPNNSLYYLQSYLSINNSTLLEFFELDNQLFTILVNATEISLFDLGSAKTVESWGQRFVDAMDPEYPTLFLEPSRKLSELIFEPLRSKIETSNLIVIPNSTIQNISFEALSNPSPKSKLNKNGQGFLIEEFSFVYTFSALSYLRSQNSSSILKDRKILAVAPVFDRSPSMSSNVKDFLTQNSEFGEQGEITVEPLLGSLKELEYISTLSKKGSSNPNQVQLTEQLLRKDASEYAIKNKNLRDFNILHFATHSFSDINDPFSSGILLELDGTNGEDGILFTSEIWGLNINANLVVLSSCDTAKAGGSKMTSLSGFASSFFFAGAENLFASIWPSDDLGNQILMHQVYSHISAGKSIASSLRSAKLELLKDDGPISHPYYWSGFIHIGSSVGSENSTANDVRFR
ncbi:MAG: CHAT domain-containing protein [Bacteroidetes bacterium]|nr:CHAT domain-containing protein [Bacteroidota bacterium]